MNTPRTLRPTSLLTGIAAVGLLLGACSAGGASDATAGQASSGSASSAQAPAPSASSSADGAGAAAALGIEGMDAKAAVEMLDRVPQEERRRDVMASVRPDELLLRAADGTETALPMPEDEFYLSVAPYATQTHECFYHSLTTCVGEFANTPVRVTVVDDAGNAIVEEDLTTYDNGFVGVWLPRDITGTITVEMDGKTAQMPVSTGPEDLTCNTQLQVS